MFIVRTSCYTVRAVSSFRRGTLSLLILIGLFNEPGFACRSFEAIRGHPTDPGRNAQFGMYGIRDFVGQAFQFAFLHAFRVFYLEFQWWDDPWGLLIQDDPELTCHPGSETRNHA